MKYPQVAKYLRKVIWYPGVPGSILMVDVIEHPPLCLEKVRDKSLGPKVLSLGDGLVGGVSPPVEDQNGAKTIRCGV